jgi:hypothetical protein
MNYYGANDYRNYLAHHGILGMKWGIRRFQPYGQGGYNRKGSKKWKFTPEQSRTIGLYDKHGRDAKKTADKILKNGINDNSTLRKYVVTREYQYECEAQVKMAKDYGKMYFTEKEEARIIDDVTRRTFKDLSSTDYYKRTKRENASVEELKKRDVVDLQKEIEAKSGDWYNGRAYGDGFREAMNGQIAKERKAAHDAYFYGARSNEAREAYRKADDKYIDALAGGALRDLGYRDTKEARRYIRETHVIDWD